MTARASDIAFSAAVKTLQSRAGSRQGYARMAEKGDWARRVTPELAAFIALRDSFYLGTASAEGQPYIQHRGGPRGFLKVLDERTLGFADFRGNRQYISAGNISENQRAFIFLMDYPARRRIKIWGRARVVEDDAALLGRLAEPGYQGTPERAIVFEIEAWDVNCPQHITPRFAEAELGPERERLSRRVAELEAEVGALSRRLAERSAMAVQH